MRARASHACVGVILAVSRLDGLTVQVFTASFRDDKGFAVSSAAEPHGCADRHEIGTRSHGDISPRSGAEITPRSRRDHAEIAPSRCVASTLDELSADQIKELYQPPFLSKARGSAVGSVGQSVGRCYTALTAGMRPRSREIRARYTHQVSKCALPRHSFAIV